MLACELWIRGEVGGRPKPFKSATKPGRRSLAEVCGIRMRPHLITQYSSVQATHDSADSGLGNAAHANASKVGNS